MPGGQSVPMASRFKGLNRLIADYLLDETESPDTADAAAYGGIAFKLGPRGGRARRYNQTSYLRGVVPLNFGWARFRVIADASGTLTALGVPWPGGSPAPVGGFCNCDLAGLGAALTGNISPNGAYGVAFTIAGAAPGTPATTLIGIDHTGSSGSGTDYLGCDTSGSNVVTSRALNSFIFGSCTPDTMLMEGFLQNATYRVTIASVSHPNVNILLTRLGDNVIINGANGNRGSSVVLSLASLATFSIGS